MSVGQELYTFKRAAADGRSKRQEVTCQCRECRGGNGRVINTRKSKAFPDGVWRRYECSQCRARWSTVEMRLLNGGAA